MDAHIKIQAGFVPGLNDADGDGHCDDEDWCFGPPDECHVCGQDYLFKGYNYSTVLIDGRCWFSENLRVEDYRNGDAIPSGLTDGQWPETVEGAVAVYGEENSNFCSEGIGYNTACDETWSLTEFGRLYNGYAILDERQLCPGGWHIPTEEEWSTLVQFFEAIQRLGCN